MPPDSFFPIGLSLKCGLLSAALNLPWGIFWGWFLARKDFRGKIALQTLLYIPLVLPPVVTGYFLLILLSRNSWLGSLLYKTLGISFVLDWKGAVVASAVVASPFMIQSVKQAVEKVDRRLEWAARTCGASPWRVLLTITGPLCRGGVVGGFFLVFARSIGEFGATIMVAGNIPQKTQTIPMAIFSKVELGQDSGMWPLIIVVMLISFAGLAVSQFLTRERGEGTER